MDQHLHSSIPTNATVWTAKFRRDLVISLDVLVASKGIGREIPPDVGHVLSEARRVGIAGNLWHVEDSLTRADVDRHGNIEATLAEHEHE